MINKVVLIGNIGRMPETRYTGGGEAVCNFRLATSERYKDRSGQQQERTEWHTVVLWGKQAELAQQYLRKGMLVYVEGKIQSREWEGNEGKRTAFEIIGQSFRMLDRLSSSAAPESAESGEPVEVSDSDIPF